MIIDNVNWFLPAQSHSPNSRTPASGTKRHLARRLARALAMAQDLDEQSRLGYGFVLQAMRVVSRRQMTSARARSELRLSASALTV